MIEIEFKLPVRSRDLSTAPRLASLIATSLKMTIHDFDELTIDGE
jgi:hypothetical protein